MDHLKKSKEELDTELSKLKQEFESLQKRFLVEAKRNREEEERLIKDLEEFKSITQSTLEIIFIVNKAGRCIFFNGRCETVLGYKPGEAVGQIFTKFVPPKEIPQYLEQLKNVYAGHEMVDFISQIYHKDGHLLDVTMNGKLISYKGEQVGLGTIRDITKRVKVEHALNESLKSYKGLFDSVTEAIYIHKEDGKFIDVNFGATIMYGYSYSELIGRDPLFVSAPGRNNLEEVAAIMRRVIETGKPEQFEFWGKRKNGEVFPKEVIMHKGLYFGEDVIITTARDITERIKADQALKESEAKYRILAEKMHDVVWILDTDLKLVYVSPSHERTLGFKPKERMAMSIDQCLVPESLDYAMQVLIREAVTSQSEDADKDRGVLLELEYYHKDGSTRWLEQSINGIYNDQGQLSGIMGVARDITERRKAREELQQSAASYKGLFNSVSDAIYVLNKEGVFIDVNQGALNMYGYTYHELVGKDPGLVSAPGMNDMNRVVEMLHRAYDGEPQQFEFWGKRKNDDIFLKDIRLYNSIYFGEMVVVAVAQDITARKQTEQALKARVEELERQIGTF